MFCELSIFRQKSTDSDFPRHTYLAWRSHHNPIFLLFSLSNLKVLYARNTLAEQLICDEDEKSPRILQCGEHARSNIVGDTIYGLSCLKKHNTKDTPSSQTSLKSPQQHPCNWELFVNNTESKQSLKNA